METDLLVKNVDAIERLSRLPLDVVSVFVPAVSAATYQLVMGVDGLKQVMDNLQRLVDLRKSSGRSTPILVPTFVKTRVNFKEMEVWYDHWLKTLGAAVITGPNDYSGRIPDISVAQMEPPKRGPCARLKNRITVLSNGKIVSCEQDVLGEQCLGTVGVDSLAYVWAGTAARLREQHKNSEWNRCKVCAGCKDWHRP
jgi:radical SAM protein with 4Fe4S-binding SPASM domain